jgi:replicative DNA helicase
MLWGANESELANDASLEGKRKIRIAKQRNGVLLTVELDFRSEIQLFQNITNQYNPF